MMSENKKIKVAVGMSGGVDSSVTAKILVDQGYMVTGFMMKFWADTACLAKRENACCDPKSVEDAKRVAEKIGIPFYVIDCREQFKKDIVDYFIEEYKNHRTPNPCVVCNEKIKFGWFLDFAKSVGCDYVATGHYARIMNNSGELKVKSLKLKAKKTYHLLKGIDSNKDQSYFLYRLNQKQLSKILFPIGEYTKDQVRAMAKKWKLPVHEKKESQEVCFVADDYREFLHRQLSDNNFIPGDIIDTCGNVLGRHEGLMNYTIGQRKGVNQTPNNKLQISKEIHYKPQTPNSSLEFEPEGSFLRVEDKHPANKKPLYVLGVDAEKNLLIVGEEKELYHKSMIVGDLNWIVEPEMKNKKLKAKIRYRAEAIECQISNDKCQIGEIKINFDKPQRAITPGQSAVLYIGDEVIGGGIIG